MRQEDYSLNVVQGTTGAGSIQGSRGMRDKFVQVSGIAGGGVVKIEGSIDGTTFVTTGGTASNMTTDGIYTITEPFTLIRVNRTTAGTGNPTVTLTGYNIREA